jgi:cytochrome P450
MISSQAAASKSAVPGPPGLPFLGALPQVRKDPLQFLSRMVREYGDVVFLGGVGVQKFFLVTHPRDIEHVWKTQARNYVKGANFQLLRPLAGSGLFLNEGESWRSQRRLLQPAFHVPRLMAMAKSITAATEAMLADWQHRLPVGQPFDLEAEMMDLAVRVSVETLFGTSVAGDAEKVNQGISTAFSILHQKVLAALPFPWWVPLPANRRFLRAVASLEEVVYRIIQERDESGAEGHDVLSTLLSVRDEAGERMPARMIRDEVVTMLVAGHESTGITLTWTLYLLSRYPQIARRVEEELAAVLGGRTPGFEDLPKLPYLGMVIKESLRLYPPFWLLTRTPRHPPLFPLRDPPAARLLAQPGGFRSRPLPAGACGGTPALRLLSAGRRTAGMYRRAPGGDAGHPGARHPAAAPLVPRSAGTAGGAGGHALAAAGGRAVDELARTSLLEN